jgi:hypothetical protein
MEKKYLYRATSIAVLLVLLIAYFSMNPSANDDNQLPSTAQENTNDVQLVSGRQ